MVILELQTMGFLQQCRPTVHRLYSRPTAIDLAVVVVVGAAAAAAAS